MKTTTGDPLLDVILLGDDGGDFVDTIEDPTKAFFDEARFGKLPESDSALSKASWDEPLGTAAPAKRNATLAKAVRCEQRIIDNDHWEFLYDSQNSLVDCRVVAFSVE